MKSPETDFEWVAAQRPDLIIAAYYDLNEADYALLSQIAPVIAAPAGYAPWSAPWQEQLKLIDLATSGSTDRAAQIIADLDVRTAAVAGRYPQLVGSTGIVADLRDGQFTLWDSKSAPSRFLQSFGLSYPPQLDALADGQGWIRLSPEQIDLLDQDVVVVPIDNPAAGKRADIERQPLYDTLAIGPEGRVVWLGEADGVLASALWFQSPLSIGYIVEKLPPLLAAAVDGDPATQGK